MRTEYITGATSRYQAAKRCSFTPAHIAKVIGGYVCFESHDDYGIWKNQK